MYYEREDCTMNPDTYTQDNYPHYKTTVSYCDYKYQHIFIHKTYQQLEAFKVDKSLTPYYTISLLGLVLQKEEFFTLLFACISISFIGICFIWMDILL